MKILHLIDERWDSGLTAYALQIAELLQLNGHEVCLGVLPGKKPETMAKARGLQTGSVGSPFALRQLLRAEPWDVVNAHTGKMHSWSLLLAPRRLPVVRTRGDARPVTAHPMSRFMYRRTAAVVAASAHIAHRYEEEFEDLSDKLTVVYPSVVTESMPPSLPLEDVVGILGRLDPVKGHAFFLEAAAVVLKERPNTTFLIAGKPANISYSLLENQARELGIENSVKYLGFQESALRFMTSCCVGVIASIGSEEVSRACLEWMAMGRPVVGTLVGCLPELIEPGETGLLTSPGEGVAMGDALLKILRDRTVMESWGKNAHKLARSKFSGETFLKNTLDVYGKATNRAR